MSQDFLYNASPVKGQPEDSKEVSTPAKATAPPESDVSTPVKSPDVGSPAPKSSGKHRRNLTLDRNQKKAGNVAVLCREAAKWLNEVLELEEGKDVAASSKDVDSFFSSIEDGVILSRVINRIDPDNPIKFRADAKPGTFMARDNIAVWLDKARALGVPDATMFEVTDLVSKKDQLIPQWHIVITILEIARAAGRFGYALPAIISLMYDEQIDVEKLAQLEEQRMALLEGDKKKKEAELEAKKDVERAERERILTSAAIERAERERSLVEAAEAKMKADAEAARLKAEAEERAARLKAEAEECAARLKAEADERERLRLQRASEEAEKAAWEQKCAQERVKHPCFQLVTTADLRSKKHKGRALGHTIMELHNRSFPPDPSDTKGESKGLSDDEKLEAFISKAIGFHEEDNCHWLLLWSDQDHASAELLGYTTLFTYHDSMYLANLCVEPESRNRGLGTALLHEAQDEAWRIGRLTAVSGTVDANDGSLQRFYRNLGAFVDVSQSVISGNAAAPPSGRLKKVFSLGEDGIVRDSDRAPKFVRATDIRLSTHIEPGPRKTKLLRDDDDGTGPLRVQRIDFPVKKPFRKSWLTLGILGAGSVSAYYYLVLKRAV